MPLSSRATLASFLVSALGVATCGLGAGCAAGTQSQGEAIGTTAGAIDTQQVATIALANVGKGACSTNSAGSRAFASSCTGNGGQPEYWCADFALWVWGQAGADTSGLTAAAGSFYTYGLDHGTLHSTPTVGDAVVFDYAGGGVADHVAIVTQVNSNGTIESVSGDWGGSSGSEAYFASTSSAVLNAPAYASAQGGRPGIIGMTISGFISPSGSGSSGSSGTPGSGGSGGSTGSGGTGGAGAGCYSNTLGKEMPDNACVQSASDSQWYQCDNGYWTDRWTDPTACDGVYPLPAAEATTSSAPPASSASSSSGESSGSGSGSGAGSSTATATPPASTTTGGGYSETTGGGYSETTGGGNSETTGGGNSETTGGGYSETTGGGYSATTGGGYSATTGGGYSATTGGGGYSETTGGGGYSATTGGGGYSATTGGGGYSATTGGGGYSATTGGGGYSATTGGGGYSETTGGGYTETTGGGYSETTGGGYTGGGYSGGAQDSGGGQDGSSQDSGGSQDAGDGSQDGSQDGYVRVRDAQARQAAWTALYELITRPGAR